MAINGALIKLEGYKSLSTDANGQAVINGVFPTSSIGYTVSKFGYEDVSGTITVTNSNVNKDLTLISLNKLNVAYANAPIIDGIIDANDPWGDTWISIDQTKPGNTTSAMSSKFQIAHNANNIYLVVITNDATPHNEDTTMTNSYERDCSEVFFSMHTPSGNAPESYLPDNGDWQIRFQRASETNEYIDGSQNVDSVSSQFGYAVKDIGTTYIQEMSFPISVLKESGNFNGSNFRFDIQIADNTTGEVGGRTQQQFWNSNTDNQWNDVSVFGSALLLEPTATYSVTFTVTDGTTAIKGATVNLPGYTATTDANGQTVINGLLPSGSIAYKVSKDNYEDVIGTITLTDSNVTENVTLSPVILTYSVTFNVTDGLNQVTNATITFNSTDYTVTNSGSVIITGIENGTYSYDVKADGYLETTGEVNVNGSDVTEDVVLKTVGIQSEDQACISIYPNPAHKELNITYNSVISSMVIYNIAGKLIYTRDGIKEKGTIRVDVSDYPQGIYLLKVVLDNRIAVERIIIK